MTPFSARVIASLALVSISFTACETPGEGAKTGAIAGAVIGAIAGGDVRSAAIGAGAGAASGALIGKATQEDRRRRYPDYERDRAYGAGYDEDAEYLESGEGRRSDRRYDYPVARPARRPGYVISPYRPYAEVNVRGVRPGARVVDPVSGEVFINP